MPIKVDPLLAEFLENKGELQAFTERSQSCYDTLQNPDKTIHTILGGFGWGHERSKWWPLHCEFQEWKIKLGL